MKQQIKHNQHWTPYILSFILPSLIIGILLAIKGIWWGSETTILASDSFHQYVIFNQTLRNALHGDGSLFYTFTSGLGLNFYALSSYYLGSFLSPLAFFFDLKSMPDFIYLITLVKFGLIGLSTYYSLSTLYKHIPPLLVTILSTSLSLMSFTTSQLEINIWLDAFILIPLTLLGVYNIVNKKGRVLYFVSLTCLFIQNYYFGFMTAIFLVLWFFLQISWDFKNKAKSIIDFSITSLLASGASLVMLIPIYLDLKTHGESLTKIMTLQTDNSWYLDIFAKYLVGNYDTTKFGAIPMIFVGLAPLLLTLLFFTLKSIHWTVKAAHFLVLSFVIASFYLQPLDLFWQGMHAPNMFLHRYAWVFSILLIFMAAQTLDRIHNINKINLIPPFLIVIVGFSITFYFKERYSFLSISQFVYTALFLFAYFILFYSFLSKKISSKLILGIFSLFSLLEVALHGHYQIEGLGAEWNFPARDSYEYQLTDIDKLVNYFVKENSSFYRTERLLPQTGNDSMKYNYNGISQFSSVRNRSSSSTLDKLGFRSDGTNLNLRYQNNTIIADSLFAIRYNLSENNPSKYGFIEKKSENQLGLYENQNALQLAFLTRDSYKDVKFTNLTLDNQTNFLNQLTGLHLQYYHSLQPNQVQNATILDNRVTTNAEKDQTTAFVKYNIDVPSNTQLYLSLPNLSFSNEEHKSVNLTVNNLTTRFTLDNAFSFFNVGYFEIAQPLEITIAFPENQQVSFDTPSFYRLDTIAYQTAINELNNQKSKTITKKNQVITDYESNQNTSLFFTLPYDKGWSATLNGKKLPIKRAQTGFMKVDIPKGKGRVVLTFIPQGFYIGAFAFIFSSLLFLRYNKKASHN